MKTLLQLLSLFAIPALLGFLLAPFLAKLDKYSKAKRDQADREFFNRHHRNQENRP